MNAIPIFDFVEAERVARVVGFNPKRPGLAQECLVNTQKNWRLPGGLSELQRFQAHFYLALGLFIWFEYGDHGLPIPAAVFEWYQTNTAAAADETLFITGLSA